MFILGGIYAKHSLDFIQNDKALSTAFKFFIIPSIIGGVYYGYRSIFGYEQEIAKWRKYLGFVMMTYIFTMTLLISFQGYLIAYNCDFGTQKQVYVKGRIIKLNYPKRKKPLNNYAIEIKQSNNEIIKLEVPTNQYELNQVFEKRMIIGSLNILYSRQ